VAQRRGDMGEAERLFRRVAGIYRKTKGENHPFVAIAESNLAGVYLDTKEFGQAESLLRGVIRKCEKTLPEDHLDLSVARLRLGRALLRQKKWAEAEKESGAALAMLERVAPGSLWVASGRTDLETAHRRGK